MKNLNYKSTNMLSIMEMLEKDIETECYICTEPTEEKSPCVCGAHVHMKCLVEWIEKNDNKRYTCSICHSDLEGIRPAKTKSSIVYKSTYRPGLIDGGHMCALILKMFYWLDRIQPYNVICLYSPNLRGKKLVILDPFPTKLFH